MRVVVEGDQREVEVELTGTKSEALLRYASGLSPAVVRLHLCPPSCDQLRAIPNLVHVKGLQRVDPATPKTWEENLLQVDEMHPLRAHQEAWNEEEKAKKRDDKTSDSSGKKKKKKKEKKDGDKSSKKKKKKKVGGRVIAKKKLEDLFSGDRVVLLRKTKKRLKKMRSSSSSSGSSSTSSSSLEVETDHLLEDKSRIQRIALLAPGLLTMQGVQNMKENINQAGGTPWQLEDATIPPICLQYTRQFLVPKATQGVTRELLTLSHLLDCLLQGRCAEAADAACQRLKALEMVQQGQSWATAAKVELVDPMVSTRPEIQIASKEAQLDAKAKGSSWSSEGKGKSKSKGKEKGKERDKGRQGGKGDAKKTSS